MVLVLYLNRHVSLKNVELDIKGLFSGFWLKCDSKVYHFTYLNKKFTYQPKRRFLMNLTLAQNLQNHFLLIITQEVNQLTQNWVQWLTKYWLFPCKLNQRAVRGISSSLLLWRAQSELTSCTTCTVFPLTNANTVNCMILYNITCLYRL